MKIETDKSAQDFYTAIGMFAISFEHLCFCMSMVITSSLQKDGLTNFTTSDIILGSNIGAEQLRRMVMGITSERYKETLDSKLCTELNNRIQKCIDTRNDILHRMWFIGWDPTVSLDTEKISSKKLKSTRNGLSQGFKDFSVKEILDCATEAKSLSEAAHTLSSCIFLDLNLKDNLGSKLNK